MSKREEWLVETDWLAEHLGAPDLVVLDASWHLPPSGRDGAAEYLEKRIPGALYFDIDDIADTTSELPHTLPPPEKFTSRMRKMGIGDGKKIVAYDSAGLFSAARVWWMFRVMGHDDVAILNGGLAKWIAEDRPLEDGPPRPVQERHFTSRMQTMMVRDASYVARASETGSAQIVDARSPGRFQGVEPEPRPELPSGHIPRSRNVYYGDLLNADGTVKDNDALQAAFDAAGVDFSKPVITSCGSGVTAAIVTLALEMLGHNQVGLYDGSWTDWASGEGRPVATGE